MKFMKTAFTVLTIVTAGVAEGVTITVSMTPTQFMPFSSATTYAFEAVAKSRFYSTVPNGVFIGEAHLPDGVFLKGFYLDACTSGSALVDAVVESTDMFGNFPSTLASISSTPGSGCASTFFDLSSANFVVNNAGLHLFVIITLEAADSTTELAGARFTYDTDVFSYPPTPIFNDVPASDPRFSWIQEMSQDGITSGCGGGNFCPNNPVTRGQMSVFLERIRHYSP
jgi:hypothetical protein